MMHAPLYVFFFFIATATPEIYTLSLHDALPISLSAFALASTARVADSVMALTRSEMRHYRIRSEEHTSELQSPYDLVCRLLLEKKKHDHNGLSHCSNYKPHYPL